MLREGNVFTPVFESFCSLRGLCLVHVPSKGVSVQRVFLTEPPPSPDRDPMYSKEWAVCILLECILVCVSIDLWTYREDLAEINGA